jgi:hypothetical protein
MLRLLRDPLTGRPGPAARLIAGLVVVGMLAVAGPPLLLVLDWLVELLS